MTTIDGTPAGHITVMQTNTLVFIIFVALMCCALASLIYFCAAAAAPRRQPPRTAPPGSPGLDEHFADVQRVLSGRSPALYAAPTPLTNSAGIEDRVADERRVHSGETPSLYAAPTSPTTSAGAEDLLALGATVFRARVAGDTDTLCALSITTSPKDLINGMILAGEFVVVELAKARGQTPDEVATDLHLEAIDRRLNQTVGGDGDSE